MRITPIDFKKADVQELLEHHLAEARNAETTNAIDSNVLAESEVTMFSMRSKDNALMGFAALKSLSDKEGEIKSVRTHPDHLRKGVSQALMAHIEQVANDRGYEKLLLETHPTEQYKAARALYKKRGYTERGPFAGYAPSEDSVFLELMLVTCAKK